MSLALLSKEGEIAWNWSNHRELGEIIKEGETGRNHKRGRKVVRKERTNQDDKILEGAAQRNATQRNTTQNDYFLFGIWLTV